MPPADLAYRRFQFPLNVFMHVLTLEEGGVTYLHYGLFDEPGEPIAKAQERSTELLLSRLPAPPATLLDVGVGVGTTLARLTRLGYDAVGITPDDDQAAMVEARYGDEVRVVRVAFEKLFPRPFDTVVFQESSQYIKSAELFAKAREITNNVVVLDEFAVKPGASLHQLDEFLRAAGTQKFRVVEDLDLSRRAAPTVDYFMRRLDRYRGTLTADLGLTNEQVDHLIASGAQYRQAYANGEFTYRLLRLTR